MDLDEIKEREISPTRTVTGNNVNYRSVASTNGNKPLGQLNRGDRIEVISKHGHWFRIKNPRDPEGEEVFISAQYVEDIREMESARAKDTAVADGTRSTSLDVMCALHGDRVVVANINYRSEPTISETSKLGQLEKGSLVRVLGTAGDWLKIQNPADPKGDAVFIASKHTKIEEPGSEIADENGLPIGKKNKYINVKTPEPADLIPARGVDKYGNIVAIKLKKQSLKSFIKNLKEAAAKEDIHLHLCSGYRTFKRQEDLYKMKGGNWCEPPGYSEHHLGTTIDLTMIERESRGFLWLLKNAFEAGWIPSQYFIHTVPRKETWHWRNVGVEAARKFREKYRELIDAEIAALEDLRKKGRLMENRNLTVQNTAPYRNSEVSIERISKILEEYFSQNLSRPYDTSASGIDGKALMTFSQTGEAQILDNITGQTHTVSRNKANAATVVDQFGRTKQLTGKPAVCTDIVMEYLHKTGLPSPLANRSTALFEQYVQRRPESFVFIPHNLSFPGYGKRINLRVKCQVGDIMTTSKNAGRHIFIVSKIDAEGFPTEVIDSSAVNQGVGKRPFLGQSAQTDELTDFKGKKRSKAVFDTGITLNSIIRPRYPES
ncbi:MAG: D-alanyl-D-alanine carboxypeptidase family protein [Patescibacteria group bacterium]